LVWNQTTEPSDGPVVKKEPIDYTTKSQECQSASIIERHSNKIQSVPCGPLGNIINIKENTKRIKNEGPTTNSNDFDANYNLYKEAIKKLDLERWSSVLWKLLTRGTFLYLTQRIQ